MGAGRGLELPRVAALAGVAERRRRRRGPITRLEPPTTIEFDTDIHGRLLWELSPDDGGRGSP